MEGEYPWHWRIMQRVGEQEIPVAGGTCNDRKTMLREMFHYAALYQEEGPMRLQTRTGKNSWKVFRE